jgi:hypothetical protein
MPNDTHHMLFLPIWKPQSLHDTVTTRLCDSEHDTVPPPSYRSQWPVSFRSDTCLAHHQPVMSNGMSRASCTYTSLSIRRSNTSPFSLHMLIH